MIVVPKEKPAIGGLNTYYVNIGRLLEHFQGEIGPGGVSFKASTAEGIVFFDKDELLNGYFNDKNKTLTGKQAIDFLITADYEYNFQLDIYRIAQEEIYFWSNLSDAETVHSDVSTKTTDLESLIKKMNAENLTGIIDASIESSGEEGLIFFSNGEIVGGSFSWTAYGEIPLKKNIENLIEKTVQSEGILHVSRIPMKPASSVSKNNKANPDTNFNVLVMLEDLFRIFETLISSRKNNSVDFSNMLKKKFIDNAEKYHFLDPFAAEFEYTDHKIRFTGKASDSELSRGVISAIEKIANEIGMLPELQKYLALWYNKYEKKLTEFNIDL